MDILGPCTYVCVSFYHRNMCLFVNFLCVCLSIFYCKRVPCFAVSVCLFVRVPCVGIRCTYFPYIRVASVLTRCISVSLSYACMSMCLCVRVLHPRGHESVNYASMLLCVLLFVCLQTMCLQPVCECGSVQCTMCLQVVCRLVMCLQPVCVC